MPDDLTRSFTHRREAPTSPAPSRPHDTERSAAIICIHALALTLSDIGKLDDDGLCFCEARASVEPSLPHAFAMPFLNSGTEKVLCTRCHEGFTHELHNRPYQRKHSDKCLRARKALDEFGEWLKTEKAGKAAPVAPEGVNAPESTS